MKILVVGGGGREHALVWKIAQSPKVSEIFCAPGNAGIAGLARCVNIGVNDIPALLQFAKEQGIHLTVVGPEAPLVAGIVDAFQASGLRIFGPRREAARIEGSKLFAKKLMEKYNIPTARFQSFTDPQEAKRYVKTIGAPCVVKADGLAAGKGVIVARDEQAALHAVSEIMEDKAFGPAGEKLVIEEFLEGEEVSILVFCQGDTIVPMVSAQDHKRVFDGDRGPNTGGMGAYSPAPVYTEDVHRQVMEQILCPTVTAMAREGCSYQGVLYAGLMVTPQGPKVLEFNARFGDPETQPVLMKLETDLVEVMEGVIEGRLDQVDISWSSHAAVCVVLASGGYPGKYETGKPIYGLDAIPDHTYVFHAGTAIQDGRIVTNGGRVLGVTARGGTIQEAIDNAYQSVEKIYFEGMHFRKDIGYRAIGQSVSATCHDNSGTL